MMTNRQWFQIFWFYLRASLFGTPAERSSAARPASQRTQAPRTAQLKPSPYAK